MNGQAFYRVKREGGRKGEREIGINLKMELRAGGGFGEDREPS